MANPIGSRDKVRFESNERVDLGDLTALQENARSESRLLVHNFLFGHGDMGLPDTSTGNTFKAVRDWAGGSADTLANWAKSGSASPFEVDAPIAGTTVTVSAHWLDSIFAGQTYGGALTGAYAGTLLRGTDAELGTACGTEGDASQIITMAGKPAATYGVFVSTTFDDATPGTRIFWDAAAVAEDAQSIDTRQVAGWNASVSNVTAGAPSDAHVLIATVAWDGAAITAFAYSQNLLFEGLLGTTTGKGLGGDFAQGWGQDGSVGTNIYGHRSDNRLRNGVSCWQDWAAALRAQLRDIIGDDDGNGVYGWYTEVSKFVGTGGAVGKAGQHASLSHFREHLDDGTDPHGATLTQTNIVVDTAATFNGSANNFNDGFFMPNAGGNYLASDPTDLPQFSATTAASNAYAVRRSFTGTDFTDITDTQHLANPTSPSTLQSATFRRSGGELYFYKTASGSGRYSLNLNSYFAASALRTDGPLIESITFSFLPPTNLASVSTDAPPYVGTIPASSVVASVNVWRVENPEGAVASKGSRHAVALLGAAGQQITSADVTWSGDENDPAVYSVDLSAVTATDLQMATTVNLMLEVYLTNLQPIDSASTTSNYSYALNSAAVICRTRLIHP